MDQRQHRGQECSLEESMSGAAKDRGGWGCYCTCFTCRSVEEKELWFRCRLSIGGGGGLDSIALASGLRERHALRYFASGKRIDTFAAPCHARSPATGKNNNNLCRPPPHTKGKETREI
jgi:hypothetical protein